jgi:hypothetical protein
MTRAGRTSGSIKRPTACSRRPQARTVDARDRHVDCPIEVIRVVLMAGQTLPVHPDQRTFAGYVSTSQTRQQATSCTSHSITSLALVINSAGAARRSAICINDRDVIGHSRDHCKPLMQTAPTSRIMLAGAVLNPDSAIPATPEHGQRELIFNSRGRYPLAWRRFGRLRR